MGEWWYVIVILVLAVLVGLFLTNRQRQSRRDRSQPGTVAGDHDYVRGREDTRQAGMSAEDRAWETASHQRNQDTQARRQAQAGAGPAAPESRDRKTDES